MSIVSSSEFVATMLLALSSDDVMFAGDPERGEFRGWPSLEERVGDAEQLALDCGLPEPDGSEERTALVSEYLAALTAALIEPWESREVGRG